MFNALNQPALLQEFFSENREALDRVEKNLLQLESAPTNRELLNSIFRDMHTVKGNCRMMGFERLEELTHAAESLLDLMREDKLKIDTLIGNQLLGVVDSVRRTLLLIEQTGGEDPTDFSAQIFQLNQFQDEVGMNCEAEIAPLKTEVEAPVTRLDSVRLTIERLDALMDQVGELGACFNHLKFTFHKNPHQMDLALESLEQQILALQREILQYRLQPIGPVLDTYHRLVRDLAVETQKKVVLDLSGEKTEVDRNVLIVIKEVLGHLIRNAVDHGIEGPTDRVAMNKSPIGHIRLLAEQKEGQIYLEVSDDGGGIDVNKVRAKAIAKNLITLEQSMAMPEAEIIRLIMTPGFSTTDEVSKISGRGAGLDVVQTAIDKLGGSVAIFNQFGLGTRFRLRIPQTMAIIPVLLVTQAEVTYALPQVNVVELVSYYGPQVALNVEGKMQSPMVRVRDRLFPLIHLGERVTLSANESPDFQVLEMLLAQSELHIVVLQAEEIVFGLVVHGIKEPVNLVIKPLHNLFADIAILAGTAVMPDGSVAFLLNVAELIKPQNFNN